MRQTGQQEKRPVLSPTQVALMHAREQKDGLCPAGLPEEPAYALHKRDVTGRLTTPGS